MASCSVLGGYIGVAVPAEIHAVPAAAALAAGVDQEYPEPVPGEHDGLRQGGRPVLTGAVQQDDSPSRSARCGICSNALADSQLVPIASASQEPACWLPSARARRSCLSRISSAGSPAPSMNSTPEVSMAVVSLRSSQPLKAGRAWSDSRASARLHRSASALRVREACAVSPRHRAAARSRSASHARGGNAPGSAALPWAAHSSSLLGSCGLSPLVYSVTTARRTSSLAARRLGGTAASAPANAASSTTISRPSRAPGTR